MTVGSPAERSEAVAAAEAQTCRGRAGGGSLCRTVGCTRRDRAPHPSPQGGGALTRARSARRRFQNVPVVCLDQEKREVLVY